MILVLDTNILVQDFLLRSARSKELLGYVAKTQSEFVVPKIIFDELTANYRRFLEAQIGTYSSTRRRLSSHLFNVHLEDIDIVVDEEVSAYEQHVLASLGLSEDDLVNLRPEYLEESVRRSIHRVPPSSEKGKEMRDVLIWLHVKDIARGNRENQVAFISKNTTDFADEDGALLPELLDEIQREGLSVIYYASLEDFARSRSTPIEFITVEWISRNLDFDRIVGSIDDKLEKALQSKLARRPFVVWPDIPRPSFVGGELEIVDYFVNELEDDAYGIEAVLEGNLEFVIDLPSVNDVDQESYGEITASGFSFPISFPVTFSASGSSTGLPRTEPQRISPLVTITIFAEVADERIVDWEVIDYAFSIPYGPSFLGA